MQDIRNASRQTKLCIRPFLYRQPELPFKTVSMFRLLFNHQCFEREHGRKMELKSEDQKQIKINHNERKGPAEITIMTRGKSKQNPTSLAGASPTL